MDALVELIADLKAARLLFADVSKQIVTLLVADPKLRDAAEHVIAARRPTVTRTEVNNRDIARSFDNRQRG